MNLIDTHCHLHDNDSYSLFLDRQKKYRATDFTIQAILDRAEANQVHQMICIGVTHSDSISARSFAKRYDNIFWTYGFHPEEVEKYNEEDDLEPLFANPKSAPVAIGEIGLDYHTPGYNRAAQLKLLETMLDLAKKHDLPVVFHIRDAYKDIWPIVDNQHIEKAVLHSFSDTKENLEEGLKRGFYIGVNGIYTFAPHLPLPPLESTVLETDAPFLAPTPYRGYPNEPAHIRRIAEWLAEKHDTTLEEVANTTTKNAQKLFNLPPINN